MIRPQKGGGAEEIRTPDLLLAKETLYQLSHGPGQVPDCAETQKGAASIAARCGFLGVRRTAVGGSGLEPETSALSGQCSNQLS
jgi:hypothetical protein